MALIYLDDFVDLNNYGDIMGVSYQISLNEDFTDLVYQDYIDKTHLSTKRAAFELNFHNSPNTHLLDKELFVRCKIYYLGGADKTVYESKWLLLNENIKKKYIQPIKYRGVTIGYWFLKNNEKKVMILGEEVD